jgi:hypothetical protein
MDQHPEAKPEQGNTAQAAWLHMATHGGRIETSTAGGRERLGAEIRTAAGLQKETWALRGADQT